MINATLRPFIAPLAALSLLLLPGCGGSDSAHDPTASDVIASNGYESALGWSPNAQSVTREQAHSGHYSVKVDGANEYGMGYGMVLGKVLDHKPSKVHIEAWGYMTNPESKARMDFQLVSTGATQAAFDDGINYADVIKDYGKWVKISKDITLPPTTTSTQEMRVFLWRAGASTPAYIDDVLISEVK